MTDKQPEALRQAAWLKREGASCQLHYDLGVLIERQHGELETLRAKLKVYEDPGDAADDVQLVGASFEAAILAEREACAKVCEAHADGWKKNPGNNPIAGFIAASNCAGDIRLRMGYAAARLEIESLRAAQPAGAQQPGAAYAAQDSEHQLAIMEGERNASLDAYSRVVSITSAESRLYEIAFTSGWDRRDRLAAYGQAPAQAADAITEHDIEGAASWVVRPAYTHPSPPEGMVGGWTKASQQLPPCRDDQLYVGINTAGFAGVFNAVIDIAGNVHCTYATPEEIIDVMGGLDIWQPITPPTTSAGSGKGGGES